MSQDEDKNEIANGQAPAVVSFSERLAKRTGDRAAEEALAANNVVSISHTQQANGTTGAPTKKSAAKAKKDSGPPMNLRVARWFFGHGMDGMKLSAEMRGENVVVRAWNGIYWQVMSENVCKAKIQKWLELYEENSCTPFVVDASWKTLWRKVLEERSWKSTMPDESHTVVLPFKDGYLHISADKAWMEDANPAYGIKHCSNVALGIKHGQPFIPQAIPSESMFGQYLTTSLFNLETRAIVQQHCALSFMKNKNHLIGWWVGETGVGKSVLVKMLQLVHGSDNRGNSNYGAIDLTRLDGEHYLANIVDKTFLSTGEVDVTKPWCENTFKMVSSGDALDVNPKGKDIFTYVCEAFIIASSNQQPVIRDESGAVSRRMQVVLWDGSMERRGTNILELHKMVFEHEPHLLVGWLVEGIQKILRQGGPVRGKDLPEHIRRFEARLKKDNDSIEAWILDCEIVKTRDPKVEVRKREIYQHYIEYCEETCIDRPRGEAVFWKILARKMGVNIDDISERRNLPGGGKAQAIVRTIAIRPADIASEKIERIKELAIQEGRFRIETVANDPFAEGVVDGNEQRIPIYSDQEQEDVRRLMATILGQVPVKA